METIPDQSSRPAPASAERLLEQCFNCHSRLQPWAPGHWNSITINGCKISYFDVLTYIFELGSTQMMALYELSVNELSLCDRCYQLLQNIYISRQSFQDLTSKNSCIHEILNHGDFGGVPVPVSATFNANSMREDMASQVTDSDARSVESRDGEGGQEDEKMEIDGIDPLEMALVKVEIDETAHVRHEPPPQAQDFESGSVQLVQQTRAGPRRSLRTKPIRKIEPKNTAKVVNKSVTVTNTNNSKDEDKSQNYSYYSNRRRKWTCPECGEVVTGYRRHFEEVHKRRASCDICGNPFLQGPTAYLVHRTTHFGDAEKLNMSYSERREIEENAEKHQRRIMEGVDKRDYSSTCDICGKPFYHVTAIVHSGHRATHLSEGDKLKMSDEELKEIEYNLEVWTAWRARQLRQSQINNNKIRNSKKNLCAECPECGKTFRDGRAVRYHINLVHKKVTKHICDICGKPESSEYGLRRHRMTHQSTDEKVATLGQKIRELCEECGVSFIDMAALRNHVKRVHEGVPKPILTCDKCGHSTTCRKSYNIHVRDHEIEEGDEYFFSCDKCDMKFKFKRERKKHGPVCPGEAVQRPFQCMEEGCERRFRWKQSLEFHLSTVHKYGPVRAYQMVYPGLPLPPKKVATAERKRKHKTKKQNESQKMRIE